MQDSDNLWVAYTAVNFLLRGPRFVRYETRLSRDELAGPNVEFSRHAARKPIVARYRRVPHGRLEFLVSGQVFNVKHYTQLFDSPHGRRERYGAILRVTLALLWTFYKHLDRDDLTQKAFG